MSYSLGMNIIKQAQKNYVEISTSSLDNPLLRTLIGTGLGALIGGAYGGVTPGMAYLSDEEKKTKAMTSILEGALYGTGVGLASNLLPDLGPMVKVPITPQK